MTLWNNFCNFAQVKLIFQTLILLTVRQ